GLVEIMAASAVTITDVERNFIGFLPVSFSRQALATHQHDQAHGLFRTYTLNCAIRSSSGSAPRPGPRGTSTPPLITGTVLAMGIAPNPETIRPRVDSFPFAARKGNTAKKPGPK